MKSVKRRPLSLWLATLMILGCPLPAMSSEPIFVNDYGIAPDQLYPGTQVTDLLHQVEEEALAVVQEAFDEGFKQGLLQAAPEAAYWKAETIRLKAQEWPWWAFLAAGGGGFALGAASTAILIAVWGR